MKHWKKSSSSSAGYDGISLRMTPPNPRVWFILAAIVLVAIVAFAVLWPCGEPEPVRYALRTAGNEIDFTAPDIQAHTAEDGIAVVNLAKPPATDSPDSAAGPVAPVTLTADPATVWQGEAAPTSGGFTMPVAMDGDSIGILTIPDLDLSVRVYETGDDMADMERGAAHFKSTSAWMGNVGLSAHNVNFDGSNGYFYALHTLRQGAVIRYETALGSREYAVESLTEIAEDDWSTLGRTEDNRITLITCISGKPDLRLCVQAVEQKE